MPTNWVITPKTLLSDDVDCGYGMRISKTCCVKNFFNPAQRLFKKAHFHLKHEDISDVVGQYGIRILFESKKSMKNKHIRL